MLKENTIKGHCTTNLDNWDVSKVKQFAHVPNIGERVSAVYNGGDGRSIYNQGGSLKVVQITHDFRNNEPYIIVELNKVH